MDSEQLRYFLKCTIEQESPQAWKGDIKSNTEVDKLLFTRQPVRGVCLWVERRESPENPRVEV